MHRHTNFIKMVAEISHLTIVKKADKAFSVSGSKIWNELSFSWRAARSVHSFKRKVVNSYANYFVAYADHFHYPVTSRASDSCHTMNLFCVFYLLNNEVVTSCLSIQKRIVVCATSTAPLRELTCHMGSHSITCHPA